MVHFLQLVKMETKSLPGVSPNLPIVRLADVEKDFELIQKPSSYIRDNIDWGNRYSYNWSLIEPVQYQSDENGLVSSKMWKDGSGVYSPSLSTRVYQLRLPIIAESLISDLIKRYGFAYRGGEFVEVEHKDFDLLIIHEVEEYKEIFASKGKAVMYVRYLGYADISSEIKLTSQKIDLISD